MSRELSIDASIFNLPPLNILFGTAEAYQEALRAMGVRGLQYAVVRNLHGRDVALQLVADGMVHSLHQSFAGPGLIRLVMPSVAGSLGKLVPLQRVAVQKQKRTLPTVVHPNEQYLGDHPNRPPINYKALSALSEYGPFLHQPTVEVLERWRVLWPRQPERTAQDMLAEQHLRGFDRLGVALDTHHLLARRGGMEPLDLEWCQRFVGELASFGAFADPGEVQLSFRPDFGGKRAHLVQALEGNLDQTPHGHLLGAIADRMPEDQEDVNVLLEVRASEFKNEDIDVGYQRGNRLLAQALGGSALAR